MSDLQRNQSGMIASELCITLINMKKKNSSSTEALGVCVNDSLHTGLSSVMTEFSSDIERKYSPDSFHRLFWTQQL